MGDLDPHLLQGTLGPHELAIVSIGWVCTAELHMANTQTDRHTDPAVYSMYVANDHIYALHAGDVVQ